MFPTSSQKKYWMFSDESELIALREKANQSFIQEHRAELTDEEAKEHFLSAAEERVLVRHYQLQLRDFCKRFNPPMPKVVIGTAFHYLKRFYLNNSVMDYHPKEVLVTCVYLACKVEEFNLSISQFVSNIKGDQQKASDIILNNELLLMQQLKYHLTVHNPYRPVEGFLIDIKTRSQLRDPDRLRPGIDEFLDKMFLTDACLLFSPSQIALAAVLQSASKLQENLDAYVTQTLLGQHANVRLVDLIEAVRKIRTLVSKPIESPSRETFKQLEKRLEKCRNQSNNPDSHIYKERMLESLNDDDESAARRYSQLSHKESAILDHMKGISKIS
uniref:Cyclin-H n=2 Tax=Cacopsylla melanoneura TaxID=428564 RepID=A0A8D8PX23_9HEMI